LFHVEVLWHPLAFVESCSVIGDVTQWSTKHLLHWRVDKQAWVYAITADSKKSFVSLFVIIRVEDESRQVRMDGPLL
jgi:hypothetical protein